MKGRAIWLVAIIAAGIASRAVHSGFILFDKYLGDALYAAMFYVLISLVWPRSVTKIAVISMAVMTAIELFQLTNIPLHLSQSNSPILRLLARLLGTQFSWLDLLAYLVGIALIALTLRSLRTTVYPVR